MLSYQNFASYGVIATGIYGNESTVTFDCIEGTGEPQWVSFYYQSMLTSQVKFWNFLLTYQTIDTDDMGFGDQRKKTPSYQLLSLY